MLVFYICLLLLGLYRCKISIKGYQIEESFSKPVTDSVKGIFIWLVFLSHFSGYVTYTTVIDILGQRISGVFGQLIVACFLFYSGYGVCESARTKGMKYIKSFPIKRIFKTLLSFDLAVVLYLVLGLLIGKRYVFSKILYSLIGWESLGNSNWYIFVIICLYIFTYLSFVISKNNEKKAAFLCTLMTLGFIVFLYFTRDTYWYDTALCYVAGMYVSIYKESLIRAITKNNLVWCIGAICVFGAFCILYLLQAHPLIGLFATVLRSVPFCLTIAFLLTKIRIYNKVLAWSGNFTFELYILQRIPMIILKTVGVDQFNIYVYFVLCVIFTLIIAVAYRFVFGKINKLLFARA